MLASYPGLTTNSAPHGDKVSAKDAQIMNENLSQGKVMQSAKTNQFSSDHYLLGYIKRNVDCLPVQKLSNSSTI
jgi:hypothetical protein